MNAQNRVNYLQQKNTGLEVKLRWSYRRLNELQTRILLLQIANVLLSIAVALVKPRLRLGF